MVSRFWAEVLAVNDPGRAADADPRSPPAAGEPQVTSFSSTSNENEAPSRDPGLWSHPARFLNQDPCMGLSQSSPHACPRPPERRSSADRRRRPTPFLAVFRPGGRRRGFRRTAEARNQYMDCVPGRVALLVIFTLGASALDAAFTLFHLQGGARELNPIMSAALQVGLPAFLGAKIFGTALGLIFLAIHQNFRFSRVALQGVAVTYGLLLGYHTFLFI